MSQDSISGPGAPSARRTGRGRVLARWLLAGPGAMIAAVLSISSMPLYFPEGAAGLDHLVFPLVLAPLIWAAACFYAVLDDNLWRATLIIAGAIIVQSAVTFSAFA